MRKQFVFDLVDKGGEQYGTLTLGESNLPNTISLELNSMGPTAFVDLPRDIWEKMCDVTASYRSDFFWARPKPEPEPEPVTENDGPQEVILPAPTFVKADDTQDIHPAIVPVLDSKDDSDKENPL
jgi:hypothetical protein